MVGREVGLRRGIAAALIATAVSALPASSRAGEGCEARSGAARATLLELYTSEGCSSCPPADRWLSRLEVPAGATFVPLGFHVDYWDGLGWKDRLASPAWTERQRHEARRLGARSVYTPQVIFDRGDFRGWFAPRAWEAAVRRAAAKPARASLVLRVARSEASLKAEVEVSNSSTGAGGAVLFLAVTESGVSTVVRAGENRGATLRHDHVVRALEPLGHVGTSPVTRKLSVAVPDEWNAANLALAAWLEDAASGEVLQAVRLAPCAG